MEGLSPRDYASVDGKLWLSHQAVTDNLFAHEFQALMDAFEETDRDGDVFSMATLDDKGAAFPRSAARRLPKELQETLADFRTYGRLVDFGPSLFEARVGQEPTVSRIVDHVQKESSGILIAGCGKGKTIMAAEAIMRLGRSACVVVHEDFLMDQFREAFKMIAPQVKVGYLKRDHMDTGHTHDVVLASTQSLTSAKRTYPQEFFDSFGVSVFDEVHMYAARVWQTVMLMFPAIYRIGLTATPDRADRLWGVITANLGRIAARLVQDYIKSTAYIVEMDTEIDRSTIDVEWLDDTMRRARILTLLANHEGRNKVIARLLYDAWEKRRKVLLVSERLVLLDHQLRLLKEKGVPRKDIGMFVGGMKNEEDRKKQASKRLVFATYQKAAVGLDIADLDSLILGTPRADIRQVVGRILRELMNKRDPVIVDLWDRDIKEIAGQVHARKKQYREMGCTVYDEE